MGCPTPRQSADQYIAGLSDGRHKFMVERFDEPVEGAFDLRADPEELDPQPLPEGALAAILAAARG